MGATIVQAKVFGELGTREYSFMVDTGSTFLALPQEEIDALEIWPESGGRWVSGYTWGQQA
jgi:predicted aspartyl protease